MIERLGRLDTVAVDKTGTLTTGFFKVQERVSFISIEEQKQLDYNPMELAAALEDKVVFNYIFLCCCCCETDFFSFLF